MNTKHVGFAAALSSITALLSMFSFGTPTQTQETRSTDAEKKALASLAEEVGEWHSKWERLDAKGKIVSTFEGTETFEYAFKPRVLRLTSVVPAMKSRSTGLKFFEPNLQKIRFLVVDDKGDYWDMDEGIDDHRVTSLPHKNADGSVMSIRFSVLKKTKDMRRVLMEYTVDGGKNWVKGNYQTLTRKKPRPK